jgi:sugar transferase (PEP-CTERM/EpsH1 system associated)
MENLLFLAHRIPYPPNKGDKIRSYHFLKHLAAEYRVYLGTFIDDPNDWQYTGKLDALCAQTCYQALNSTLAKIKSAQGLLTGQALSLPYYYSSAMQAWVDQTIREHKIKKVLIFSSVMAQFINPSHPVESLVDFVDVDSDKWQQYAASKSGLAKWIYQRESKRLLDFEKQTASQAKTSIFVSEQEAALFKSLAPSVADKVTYVNNGVDTDYFSPEHNFSSPYAQAVDALVFTGAMDYWANVDAVKWFAEEVMPKVVARHPRARFYIVGSKPDKAVQDLANEAVIVTGRVDDVRPFLAHAALVVAPLRIARGIQNKVLEAMAMGKYVVASTAAIEGIPVDDKLALSIDDAAESMASQINLLLNAKPAAMTENANRDYVKTAYSWQHNVERLAERLNG